MAGSQVNRHQKNQLLLQRKADAKKGANADGTRRPSSPIQHFQKITQRVMSSSRTDADHHIDTGPDLHNSEGISRNLGIDRCNSVTACPTPDDGSRRFSHHTASSTNRGSATSSYNFTHHNLPQHKVQDRRLLQTARSLHPTSSNDGLDSSDQTLTGNRASSMQLASSKTKKGQGISSQQKAYKASPIAKANSVPVCHDQVVQAKLASRKFSRPYSQASESAITEKNQTGRIETRDLTASHKRQNELCQDCRSSIMQSVCFINNDGRIAAAVMNRMHYCKKLGCAANPRSYYLPTSTSPKRAVVSKRQAPLTMQQTQHSKNKLHHLTELGDRPSASSSTSSSIPETNHDSQHQNLVQIKETCMAARTSLDGDAESLLTSTNNAETVSQNGVCHSSGKEEEVLDNFLFNENLRCSFSSMHIGESGQTDGENNVLVESSTPAGSCISFDMTHDHDGDDGNHKTGSSVEQDAIDELHDSKPFCYHGDNEYSCSEDGTDATTTPNSLTKGAFDNLSNIDVEEHQDSKVSPTKRSPLAWMRHRYLESLKEQEAERVRLRKQEIMARKQAEDWMLDCHMEELLHKLAPNGEARVKVLVEAFETVIHHSDSESSQTHHLEHNQMHDEQEE